MSKTETLTVQETVQDRIPCRLRDFPQTSVSCQHFWIHQFQAVPTHQAVAGADEEKC